jgi:nucleoside 2-deoxyribosyltransferase
MKKLVLYIAHPIETRHKMIEIKERLERNYPVRLVSPFYEIARKEIKILDSLKTKKEICIYKQQWTKKIKRDIVELDLKLIDECDGILAYVPYPTIGTSMEIQYAKDKNKLVYTIAKKYADHPWIVNNSTKIFTKFSAFELYLMKKTNRILCKTCGLVKPNGDFYKSALGGSQRMCIDCYRDYYLNNQQQKITDARKNRLNNIEYIRKYDRNRGNKIRKTKEHLCRMKTIESVRLGKLKKSPCKMCNKLIVEAHHEDYNKPLKVVWLCHKHHMELHRLKRRTDAKKT